LLKRAARYGLASSLLAGAVVATGTGCLDRPVGLSKPVTTNVVVQKQANNAVTAIDLLLMIDNSSSMADKQATLAAAVPQLLTQLVQPACVDASDVAIPGVYALLGANPPCQQGSPEFNPVNNIHVGIVTSSLGDHGYGTTAKGLCYPGAPTSYTDATGAILQLPDVNDMSHLMGTLARGAAAAADPTTTNATIDATQGFLAWGALTLPQPPNNSDLTAATKIFRDLVAATAEKGCGLEAQLEGWFRFLIDPVPPILPLQNPDANGTHRQGSDDILLAQRAAFLRPDSLLAIVMLTDENDCSIRDTDVGWVADRTDVSIAPGSPACATNPNDKCCFSCTAPIASCPQQCVTPAPAATTYDDGPYQANLRGWQQKRRFGYEFLYPTSRYVVGLTNKELCPDQSFGDMDCDCVQAHKIGASCNIGARRMPNPLYSNTVGQLNNGQSIVGYKDAIPRADNSAIFLAGIVGVPWQDISEQASQAAGVDLQYIPVTDARWTDPGGIWDQIYADDNMSLAVPLDIHMVESVDPRPGVGNPDAFNGHDYTTAFEDLEYACIYTLPTPKPCACTAGATDYAACKYKNPNDCCDLTFSADGRGGPPGTFNKPLCNGNTQVSAKGYPGLRELQVMHDYALSAAATTPGNSIVASICPKDLTVGQESSPGYGYNPAVAALINRLKEKLKGSCLPRPLTVRADGTVPCNVIEVVTNHQSDCNTYCKAQGRDVPTTDNLSGLPSAQMTAAVTDSMQKSGICGVGSRPACATMCLCLLSQEAIGANLTTCQDTADGPETTALPAGYCYVDPGLVDANGAPLAGNNPDIVAKCPATQPRILRFVGNNISTGTAVPLAGAYVFTACQGSAVQ
jgi:hypothetical protein